MKIPRDLESCMVIHVLISTFLLQHVDLENSYLCGYLKIKGLTEEYPTLTTFFDGEIISKKHPFLTRKWDADEDVDRKHWVSLFLIDYKGCYNGHWQFFFGGHLCNTSS